MKILTYISTDPDTPEGFRAIARIRMSMPGAKGKMVEDFSPVIFQGSDPEALREVAQQWFDGELARAEAKAGKKRGRPKKDAAPAPAPADDDAVI